MPDHPSGRSMSPDYIVGIGQVYRTVQDAVNQVILDRGIGKQRVVIGITPGVHTGLVFVPKLDFKLTILGLGRQPSETVLTENVDAEMPGHEFVQRFAPFFENAPSAALKFFRGTACKDKISTANASVMRIDSDDAELLNLTIQNTYNADRSTPKKVKRNSLGQCATGQHQAVALLISGGDRVLVKDVALKSLQDTLYLRSPCKKTTARTCFINCEIEGDVDFIFGQSTAWFGGCTIRTIGKRTATSWVVAPSTNIRTPFGFVFDHCSFINDGSSEMSHSNVRLGRQWFEGVRATPYGVSPDPNYRCDLGQTSSYDLSKGVISLETLESVGKCAILNSTIASHINSVSPWDVWGGSALEWSLRYRPVLYAATDMCESLSKWLEKQGLQYDDIDPSELFLAEYRNHTV